MPACLKIGGLRDAAHLKTATFNLVQRISESNVSKTLIIEYVGSAHETEKMVR